MVKLFTKIYTPKNLKSWILNEYAFMSLQSKVAVLLYSSVETIFIVDLKII